MSSIAAVEVKSKSTHAEKILVDTDVLVDYLRDYPPAVEYLESREEDLSTSVIERRNSMPA